jgi:hypothetical protein
MTKKKPQKKKRKKISAAWKELRKIHRKGPKRVRIDNPRRKNGVDPLTVRKNIKIIRVFINKGYSENNKMTIIIFNRVFEELGLFREKSYKMERNKLTRAGIAFKKLFDTFGHNEYLQKTQKEMKLDNAVGRCLIFAEHFKVYDTTLYITPAQSEKNERDSTLEHVQKLFQRESSPVKVRHEVEYM